MAIDTREKRFSMLNFGDGAHIHATFEADGTVDGDDKQHLLDCYSGIAFAADVTVTPSPAIAFGETLGPTVVLGSVSVTPSPAIGFSETLGPTVVLGSISITPNPAIAFGETIDPTVQAGGDINFTPNPAIGFGETLGPTVVLGSTSVTPNPAIAFGETLYGVAPIPSPELPSGGPQNIKVALYDFLTDDSVLSDPVRNLGREVIRDLVGTRIYPGRRPQNKPGMALTMTRAAGGVLSAIDGPMDTVSPVVDFTLWFNDKHAQDGWEEDFWWAIKSLFHQYRGPLNDEITVQTIHLEAEPFERPIPPIDQSDLWTHRQTSSWMVVYQIAAPAAPVGVS